MNTIGWAPCGVGNDSQPKLPGLTWAGTTIGGVFNNIGFGSEASVNEIIGDVFYLYNPNSPFPGPLLCSPTPVGLSPPNYSNVTWETSQTTSLPVSLAAGSVIPFCRVFVNSALSLAAGRISCTTTPDPELYLEQDWSMAGFGTLDVGVIDESFPSGSGFVSGIPAVDAVEKRLGCLLRPTPLTWPGQDPHNEANRTIWHTNELAAVTWHIKGYGAQVFYQLSVDLTGMTYATFPDYCTIPTPFVEAAQPGELQIGDAVQGLRPRGWRRHDDRAR